MTPAGSSRVMARTPWRYCSTTSASPSSVSASTATQSGASMTWNCSISVPLGSTTCSSWSVNHGRSRSKRLLCTRHGCMRCLFRSSDAADEVGAGFAVEGVDELLRAGDEAALAAALEEAVDGFDLG